MGILNSKDPFDAFGISHGYLNVVFVAERRTGIEVRSFDEDAFYCVEGLFFFFCSKVMQVVQNGTIQIVAETIWLVLGQRFSCLVEDLFEALEGCFGELKSSACSEVEAEAEIDDCSDYSWLLDFGTLPF